MIEKDLEFNKKNILELRKESVDEINKYYRELRKYEFDNDVELKSFELRKKIHPLMMIALKIDRILNKEKVIIIGDKRKPHHKPVIFAATHIGGNDIMRVFEAIKEHAYIMLGDPGIVYVNEIRLFLELNGFIPVDTRDKEDRKIAYTRSVEVINNNVNMLIFPEGAYNVFEHLPIMKIFPGVVRMAKETNSEIIPIAIEQYGKDFLVNIGENIKIDNNMSDEEANVILTEILSTLKWQIWETQEIVQRESYTDEYINNFRQSVVDRDDYGEYVYTLQDIYDTMYHDKNIVSLEEAFESINKIITNNNNKSLILRKTK